MLSVFLVDDEALIRRGIKKLIPWEDYGFKITGEACGGEEALELINHENADIVITDLKMRFMDGIELTEKLKNSFPGIKVIVLTGFDDFPYMQQSIRLGVADYLLKPVTADALLESLTKVKHQIEQGTYPYPFELERKLLDIVLKADGNGALSIIEELFEGFIKNKVQFDVVHMIIGNMVEAVNKFLNSEGIDFKYILDGEVLNNYFKDCETVGRIKEKFNGILTKAIRYIRGETDTSVIIKIKEYIDKNYSEDISLNMLADKFFMSPTYLSKLFKNETDENYNDYLSGVRMEKAMKLLKDSNIAVQQISEMVGYESSKYFSQLFKKYTGLLPSQYRQKS